MAKKRIAAYTKISNSDVADIGSPSQYETFQSLIAKREDCELVEYYYEEVRSRNTMGLAFEKMMKDAEAHKFDYLLIMSVSRLSRKPTDAIAIIKKLTDLGIVVYFVQENLSTKDEKFGLLLTLLHYTEELGLHIADSERAAADEAYENSFPPDED